MNRIRKEVSGKTGSGPEVRFESQSLTSHAGLVVFQRLFSRLGLKERLRGCFPRAGRRAYAPHVVALLLVVHLLLGCRQLRDMARYRNDEAVRRAVGLRRLPDVSTVSRSLSGRELQMATRAPSRRTTAKRSPLWSFAQPRTMRNDFLLRAGRFLNRAGKPVLSIMRDDKTEEAMSEYLAALAT